MQQIPPEVLGDFERFPALGFREDFCNDPLDLLKGSEANRFSGHLDPVKKILPAFRKRLADAGNFLDAQSRPFDQSQKFLGQPRFEELPGDQWQGHRMPENPVVGMVGFLLGHGLNNGVGQRRKTSSIAVRLAVLENSALMKLRLPLNPPRQIVWGDWGLK